MGKAKSLTINGHYFATKTEAKKYFLDQRDKLKNQETITEGVFFEELKELYTLYCKYSSSWEFNGRKVIGFKVGNEKRRSKNRWHETICYKVVFSNSEIRPFSINKALDCISKNLC